MDYRFEPEKSEIFTLAKLILLYQNPLILLIRLAVIGFLLILGIFTAQGFPFGLLILFLSFEIFYYSKLKRIKPKFKVSNFPSNGNLADCFSLELAKNYLQAKNSAVLLFWQLAKFPECQLFLKRLGFDLEKIKAENFESNLNLAIDKSFQIAKKLNLDEISPLILFWSFFLTFEPLKKLNFEAGISEDDLENIAFWVREEIEFAKKSFLNFELLTTVPGIAQNWSSGYTLETEKYTHDLTRKLTQKQTSLHLVGREAEIAQIEEILARDSKKNVVLVGEPGVGKSTIVYQLALRSYSGKIHPKLEYKRVLELLIGNLLTAGNLGELEQRLQAILAEIEKASDVIFYIPEIENLAGATIGTEKVDLTGVLLPTLQGSKVQVIAITTPYGFRDYIEVRPAFAAQFEKIVLLAPELSDAVRIAEEAAVRIEAGKKVSFTYGGVLAAVKLSDRYLKDRVLPGKAIDLLDQAAVRAVKAGKKMVTEEIITQLISEKKGLPLEVAKGEEGEKLLKLEEILHLRVVDQNQAIAAIANTLRRARAKVRQENKPIGSFLFLGPTGVGKTETTRALAESYFGGEEKIIRLDCSEYQSDDSSVRLIGSHNQKGQLTEQVRSKPFSLILLDEIEKANRAVWQLFLQVFDEARLTDGTGQTIDFRETLIIATSNAGAELIREALLAKKDILALREELLDVLFKNNIFTPEFLNRFDDIILFKPLNQTEIEQIVKLQLEKVAKNLSTQEISIETSTNLISYLAKVGFDPVFGARPIRRLVAKKIEDLLAAKILSGEIKRGDKIYFDIDEKNQLTFSKSSRVS